MKRKFCRITWACFLCFLFFVPAVFSQSPPNDDCGGAITLDVNPDKTCTAIYTGNTGYASQSIPACINYGYDAKDVWFKFTAIAPSQRITVTPLATDNFVFEVFEGTCSNLVSLGCVNTGSNSEPDVVLLNNFIPGNSYYIRVYQLYGGAAPYLQFSICISTTTTVVNNDDCSDAENVVPYTSNYSYVQINNTGATQSMAGCFGTAEDDIWFKFTATASRHRIQVSTEKMISPVLEIFSGTCGSLVSIACRHPDNGNAYSFVDADLTNLTPGTTYYYRVYGAASNNERTNILTAVSTPPPAPPNDECSAAIVLSVNADATCGSINAGTTGYASQSLPSCTATGYDARDVWFRFTAVAASQKITVTPLAVDNFVFQVYEGDCNNLVSLACVNTGGNSEPDVVLLNNFIPGNTYYVRVYNYYGEAGPSLQFNICISSTSNILNNDDCSGAENVVPYTDNFSYVQINNTGATQSMAACYGTAEDDIWFKFTAISPRHRIVVTTENAIYPVLQIFSGSCGSLVPITCRYIDNGTEASFIDADLTNLIPGTTYYYRVYGAASNNIRTNILTAVSTPPPAPLNDECSAAIVLSVNADATCGSINTGTTGYASQSLPSCMATGYDARDVWFKFTAVAASQKITVTPLAVNNFVFQVYEGDCNNLVSLACVNTGGNSEPDVVLLNNFIPGNTYYVRVYNYYGEAGPSLQFNICISSTANILNNDDCSGAENVVPYTDNFSYVQINNTGATQSMAACYGTAEDDIWFKFTAISPRHKITVTTEMEIYPVLQVFNGSCESLVPITCRYPGNGGANDFVDVELTSLIPGTTYFYRVYGAASNNVRTNITTAVSTPPRYIFNGNGNWDNPANWKDGEAPPAITSASTHILVSPIPGGQCIINVPVNISNGASLVVTPGAILKVNGHLTINQ